MRNIAKSLGMAERDLYMVGAVAIGVVLFYPGVMEWIARRTAQAAGHAATGAVVGVGEALGIPATNVNQCAADRAAGRTWEASFSCDAATFARYLAGADVDIPEPATGKMRTVNRADGYAVFDEHGNIIQ